MPPTCGYQDVFWEWAELLSGVGVDRIEHLSTRVLRCAYMGVLSMPPPTSKISRCKDRRDLSLIRTHRFFFSRKRSHFSFSLRGLE